MEGVWVSIWFYSHYKYIFISETSNHVLYKIKNIYFLYFRREQCVEDWVEIYQIYRNMNEELVGRYCSQSSPGPVVSLSDVAVGLKVFLHTDSKDVYSGFLGKYTFFPAKSSEKEGTFSMISDYIRHIYKSYSFTNIWIHRFFLLLGCGRNITGELDGILHSPNFPEKYASSAQENITQQCHWFIHVKPGHKVLLYFEEFEVEGKPEGKFNLLGLA